MLTYQVEVYTGHMSDAGTDAKVHVMLVGERGDTGFRQLLKPLSTEPSHPFQPGQVRITMKLHHSYSCFIYSNIF